jgi:unsaturated chondroitin disaccharide hydrolase
MASHPTAHSLRPALEHALETVAAKARTTIDRYGDHFSPMYTREGRWEHGGDTWTHWCEGFFPGMMWLLERHTGDPFWRLQAEEFSRRLEPRQHDRTVHDLGFLFLTTYLPWFERTGEAGPENTLIQAGKTLALRFMPRGGYLRSFVAPDSLFIDIMMNVPIIFDAAKRSEDEALHEIAVTHCRTTERYLVRPDGGTAHEGLFDLATGAFLRQSTHQGYRADSTWTRGLAWSLHGFAWVFTYTGDPRDLSVARLCAECYLRRAPVDLIPPWDFDAPCPPEPLKDSSAAAIAASGLLLLSRLVPEQTDQAAYRTAGLSILESLCSSTYLADSDPAWEGILKHGVYHIHKKLGVDESVVWGDYFFTRALSQALDLAALPERRETSDQPR